MSEGAASASGARRAAPRDGRWWRFALAVAVTAVVLVPIGVPVAQVLTESGPGLRGLLPGIAGLLGDGTALRWFGNSLAVTAGTVAAAVLLGAPAGYVLSRGRGRAVRAFGLIVFVLQALPTILLIVPLFVMLAALHLVGGLLTLAVIYAGMTAAVAAWTMAAALDAVPPALEEAAWLDGCSVLGGFVRIVLPSALPGVLATVVFTFLFVWNEYLTAVIFLTSDNDFTVAIGIAGGRGPLLDLAAMVPPLLVFAVLHRFLRFGGLGGSVTG